MCWRIIIPVFLVQAFNVKSILCIINYRIISNIHNKTPTNAILFTDICIGDIFNRHDVMKHRVKDMFYYYYLWAKIKSKRKYEWLRAKRNEGAEGVLAERGEAPFTIYSWTIRIMCYIKIWKYIIAIRSLVLCRGFIIRCAILVYCNNGKRWKNLIPDSTTINTVKYIVSWIRLHILVDHYLTVTLMRATSPPNSTTDGSRLTVSWPFSYISFPSLFISYRIFLLFLPWLIYHFYLFVIEQQQ